MRKLVSLFAAVALVLSATSAQADLGDQLFKLLAEDGVAGDEFGSSIAIDDGVVVVGVFRHDGNGGNSGAVYLFDASTGDQIAMLVPDDAAPGDIFGSSVAIDNGVVAVGATGDDDNGAVSGSAYLFDVSTGAQLAKLLPDDGASTDFFGCSISIDSGVVAVGAFGDSDNGPQSGSAYLFDVSTGAQLAKLLPRDGELSTMFGNAIAIDGGVVAVGSKHDGDNGILSGSAYLFDVASGAELMKLLPRDGVHEDQFGVSIAIDGGVVAVGASFDDDNGIEAGSAYLFDVSSGAELAKLLPADGTGNELFGSSIAIDNGVVAVGAPTISDNSPDPDSGSAYLFDALTGAQIAKLIPGDAGSGDEFGYSISFHNGVVASGARFDSDNGIDSGSAYVFNVPGGECPADLDGNGAVGAADLAQLLGSWGPCAGCPADLDDDGDVDAADLAVLLGAWGMCQP